MLDAQIRRQEEQVALSERTWTHDVAARARRGAPARRPRRASPSATHGAPERARDAGRRVGAAARRGALAARPDAQRPRARARAAGAAREAEEGQIALAQPPARGAARSSARSPRASSPSSRCSSRSTRSARPRCATVVQTQLLWPGELAQPGTPLALGARPARQVRADLRAGRPTRSACASAGASRSSSTARRAGACRARSASSPTRRTSRPRRSRRAATGSARSTARRCASSRSVERFQPGTEGNVYLLDGERSGRAHRRRDRRREATRERDGRAPPSISLRGLVKRFGARRALGGRRSRARGPAARRRRRPRRRGQDDAAARARRAARGRGRATRDVLGVDLRGDVRAAEGAARLRAAGLRLQRELSVFENLRVHRRACTASTPASFERRAGALLERTGARALRASGRPGALSGGMKQKLAVANALLPEPALLVLDEPTAGVDVVARARDLRAARRAARASTLILLSTSYLDEAAACERLVYLDAGRVVANGTPEELRARAPARALPRLGRGAARPRARPRASCRFVVERARRRRSARVEVARAASPGAEAALARAACAAGRAARRSRVARRHGVGAARALARRRRSAA